MKILLIPIAFIILGAAYFAMTYTPPSSASTACVAKCKEMLASIDISSGPCLSNEIQRDWVCDMVHNPRIPTDNLLDNQCSSFTKGNARHFVEVDSNCEVVRVY